MNKVLIRRVGPRRYSSRTEYGHVSGPLPFVLTEVWPKEVRMVSLAELLDSLSDKLLRTE